MDNNLNLPEMLERAPFNIPAINNHLEVLALNLGIDDDNDAERAQIKLLSNADGIHRFKYIGQVYAVARNPKLPGKVYDFNSGLYNIVNESATALSDRNLVEDGDRYHEITFEKVAVGNQFYDSESGEVWKKQSPTEAEMVTGGDHGLESTLDQFPVGHIVTVSKDHDRKLPQDAQSELLVFYPRPGAIKNALAGEGWRSAVTEKINGWGLVVQEKHRVVLIKKNDLVFFAPPNANFDNPMPLTPAQKADALTLARSWAQANRAI